MSHFKKWMLLGPTSVILTGAGLCFAIEAAFIKHSENGGNEWIWYGTGALIVFNAGISLFGDAMHARMKHYLENRKE
ncbi:hypothetical protein [Ekhidna sp.]|uniref:hypothetical protein n=1 Tax=Ekhidna sp. TaxID=2608089 RepID=UPI003CCBDC44